MDHSLVRRFLDLVPHVPNEDVGDQDPPGATSARWRELAEALGVPCAPELLALAEEQARRAIFASPWELLDPASARAEHRTITDLARTWPCLAPQSRMLPIFTADGDLLLLARDGAIRRCSLTSGALPFDHGVVVPTFAALLEAFVDERSLPGLSSWYEPRGGGWRWVDELEYGLSAYHHHEERDGAWTCVTTLTGDLAPHYFRWPDGPERPPLDGHRPRACAPFIVEFVGDPPAVPRVEPVGVLLNGERRIDLAEEGERFVRRARARGWTGRDGKKLVLDGWEALGLSPPVRVETV
jgi:hypothetical protein